MTSISGMTKSRFFNLVDTLDRFFAFLPSVYLLKKCLTNTGIVIIAFAWISICAYGDLFVSICASRRRIPIANEINMIFSMKSEFSC